MIRSTPAQKPPAKESSAVWSVVIPLKNSYSSISHKKPVKCYSFIIAFLYEQIYTFSDFFLMRCIFFAFLGPKRHLVSSGIVRKVSYCFAQNGASPPLMREERQIFVQNRISSPFGSEKRKTASRLSVKRQRRGKDFFWKTSRFALSQGYQIEGTHKSGLSVMRLVDRSQPWPSHKNKKSKAWLRIRAGIHISLTAFSEGI